MTSLSVISGENSGDARPGRVLQRFAQMVVAILVAMAALALAGPAGAANSENAALCRADWEILVDPTTGSAFENRGACVSYGARGGALGATTANVAACDSAGGTFGADDQTGVEWDAVLWTCNGFWTEGQDVAERSAEQGLLSRSCQDDVPIPNTHLSTPSISDPSVFVFTCGLLDPFNA